MRLHNLDETADQRLRKLVSDSGMPLSTLAQATETSSEKVLGWWSCHGHSLTEREVESLGSYLGISMDCVLEGSGMAPIDLIRRRLFDGPQVLPDIYSKQASSYVRSSAHIIDYISMSYGRGFVDRLLQQMNVHPLLFDNLDNRINLLFFIDLLNQLRRAGLSETEVESLACFIFLRIESTSLGHEFQKATNYRDCYGVLSKYIGLFDNNFEYHLEIERREVRMYAKPTEAAQILADNEPDLYHSLFAYKRKLAGWIPSLSNLAPVSVLAPKCVSRGDPYTEYIIELPLAGFRQTPNLHLLRRT